MKNNIEKQIHLTESQLREFISYSVSRLLREGLGRDIYDWDSDRSYGYEGSRYGRDTMDVELGDSDGGEFDEAVKKIFASYGITDEDDIEQMWTTIFPATVTVSYNVEKGRESGDYDTPDSQDEATVEWWEMSDYPDGLDKRQKEILDRITDYYMRNIFDLQEKLPEYFD